MLEVYACEMEKASRANSEDKMSVLCADLDPPPPEKATVQIVLFSAVRDKFAYYDEDKSGTLQKDEVAKLLKDLSGGELSEEEIRAAMEEIDEDNSGLVELDEFLPWWRRRGGAAHVEVLPRAALAIALAELAKGDCITIWQRLDVRGAGGIVGRATVRSERV